MTSTPITRSRRDAGGVWSGETHLLFWLAFEEDGVYYGVCLNRYMVATAPSAESLEAAIVEMMDAHVAASKELEILPFAHLPQAPAEYWTRWLEVTRRSPLKTFAPSPGTERPPVQLATETKAA